MAAEPAGSGSRSGALRRPGSAPAVPLPSWRSAPSSRAVRADGYCPAAGLWDGRRRFRWFLCVSVVVRRLWPRGRNHVVWASCGSEDVRVLTRPLPHSRRRDPLPDAHGPPRHAEQPRHAPSQRKRTSKRGQVHGGAKIDPPARRVESRLTKPRSVAGTAGGAPRTAEGDGTAAAAAGSAATAGPPRSRRDASTGVVIASGVAELASACRFGHPPPRLSARSSAARIACGDGGTWSEAKGQVEGCATHPRRSAHRPRSAPAHRSGPPSPE